MTTVPLGEAKNNLSKLVDEAAAGKIITIAKHGRRSEERRVGKECRARWSPEHQKKKKEITRHDQVKKETQESKPK